MSKRFILEQQLMAKGFESLEHEKRVSNRLVDILNKGNDHSLRMASLADALFNSGHLSLLDSDPNLDDLLSAIYQIKVDAHLKWVESLIAYLEINNHTSKENGIDLFDGNKIYLITQIKKNETFKTIIYETENLSVYGFISKYRKNTLTFFKTINIEWLSVRNEKSIIDKLEKEIIRSKCIIHADCKVDSNTKIAYDFEKIGFNHIKEVNEVLSTINGLISSIEVEDHNLEFK